MLYLKKNVTPENVFYSSVEIYLIYSLASHFLSSSLILHVNSKHQELVHSICCYEVLILIISLIISIFTRDLAGRMPVHENLEDLDFKLYEGGHISLR